MQMLCNNLYKVKNQRGMKWTTGEGHVDSPSLWHLCNYFKVHRIEKVREVAKFPVGFASSRETPSSFSTNLLALILV